MNNIISKTSSVTAANRVDGGASSSQPAAEQEGKSGSATRARPSTAHLPPRVASSQSPRQSGELTADQLKAQAEEFVSHSTLPESLQDLTVRKSLFLPSEPLTSLPKLPERLQALNPTGLSRLPELPDSLNTLSQNRRPDN